ncbi:hypothetical protein C0J52_04985 [Blattella germanica]|nr:hypothetical protein C0J52_04985 [Blattella germanica]
MNGDQLLRSCNSVSSVICSVVLPTGRAAMSFYTAPGFQAVATMVGYSPAITSSVPLSQPLVAPLPLPPAPTPAPGPPTKAVDVLPPASFHNSDPVTKAVMDNIMGKLPTKKQAVSVKSQEILKQLQSSGQTFTRDEKTRILKCEVCDVVVNSSQQLQTHLAGNKHKQKALKKGALATTTAATTTTTAVSATTTTTSAAAASTATVTTTATTGTITTNCKVVPVGSDAAGIAPTPAGEVPLGVQKLPEAAGAKANKYFCDTCNVSLNSEIQLEQHLGSRKHKDKLLNGGKTKPRMAPYWKKQRPSYQQGGKPNKVPMAIQYSQPLSSNFVSGGALM